ncbi:MAG: hypothetical protein GXO32_00160 [Crenarchaeota archaeon]|nr:hypothetical protein [Thermoproteota archaeon]
MPDVFTVLNSIVRRAIGSIPSNSYVFVEPPRRAIDIGRAIEEIAVMWLRGSDVRVSDVVPMAAPRRVVEELASMLDDVVAEIERSEIASFELAYAVARAAAALCVSAGRSCSSVGAVERARRLARFMASRSRALEEVLRGSIGAYV